MKLMDGRLTGSLLAIMHSFALLSAGTKKGLTALIGLPDLEFVKPIACQL